MSTTNELNKIDNKKSKKISTTGNFIIGGIAGCTSQVVTHPMDVLKIHMQISNTTFRSTVSETLNHAGIRGFYIGLRAAILRQITYSTTRLGIYHTLLDHFEVQFGHLNYPTLMILGMLSGAIGSFIGTPADLIMIRMISDVRYLPKHQWNYKNSFSGLITIINNEGFFNLWRGAVPTMGRAAIVNGINLGIYSTIKLNLLNTGYFHSGIIVQLWSSLICSVITSFFSHPIDLAKTKIQDWQGENKPGMLKILFLVSKESGFLSLWRGMLPYFIRNSMNYSILMITIEQLQDLYLSTLD